MLKFGTENVKFQKLTFGAFIYPDHVTSIVGRFADRLLVYGTVNRIAAQRVDKNGINWLSFQDLSEQQDKMAIYRYDPPSHYRFGDNAEIPDPFEEKTVQVTVATRNLLGRKDIRRK